MILNNQFIKNAQKLYSKIKSVVKTKMYNTKIGSLTIETFFQLAILFIQKYWHFCLYVEYKYNNYLLNPSGAVPPSIAIRLSLI